MKSILTATTAALMIASATFAADTKSLYEIPLKDIKGNATSLKTYEGKVMLIVNVASKCGNTPQYKGLEAIQRKYHDQGFTVLGFPCNDFGGQEPGTNEKILEFCTSTYDVTFPMFDKLHVKGAEQHPLYASLTGKGAPFPGDVKWNFGKFLVGRDGKILKRFEPGVQPESAEVIAAIQEALKSK
jgi:glutathione peroxidase